jgi:small subunit ribosomal protein S6
MSNYQMLFIIENEIDETVKATIIDKFSDLIASLGGSIESIDKWGTRVYAFPIKHKTEGYYVLINFSADANVPAEIDRQMRIHDGIVRQMITLRD